MGTAAGHAPATTRARFPIGVVLVTLLFLTSGSLHFLKPDPFIRIVPPYIPNAPLMVALSGVGELAGAVGILVPFTRRMAAWGLIVLMIAVFPANIYMLQQAYADPGSSAWYRATLWVRLSLQPLLIWYIWKVGVRDTRANSAR